MSTDCTGPDPDLTQLPTPSASVEEFQRLMDQRRDNRLALDALIGADEPVGGMAVFTERMQGVVRSGRRYPALNAINITMALIVWVVVVALIWWGLS